MPSHPAQDHEGKIVSPADSLRGFRLFRNAHGCHNSAASKHIVGRPDMKPPGNTLLKCARQLTNASRTSSGKVKSRSLNKVMSLVNRIISGQSELLRPAAGTSILIAEVSKFGVGVWEGASVSRDISWHSCQEAHRHSQLTVSFWKMTLRVENMYS